MRLSRFRFKKSPMFPNKRVIRKNVEKELFVQDNLQTAGGAHDYFLHEKLSSAILKEQSKQFIASIWFPVPIEIGRGIDSLKDQPGNTDPHYPPRLFLGEQCAKGIGRATATCLTLDMAYNNARQLARPDRDWLAP